MSIRIMHKVWEAQGLAAPAKLVLLKLADNANDDGVGWPSLTHIERQTGLGRSTICRHITDMEAANLLHRERGHEGQSTRYHLHAGAIDALATLPIPEPENAKNEGSARAGLVPERDQGSARAGLPQSQSGTRVVPERDTNHHRTISEPSENPQGGDSAEISKKSPKAKKASKAKSRDHEGAHLFPDEWQQDNPFTNALADYYRQRREKRQAATPTAAELIRKKLLAAGLETATLALQDSAANGWTGVFPERHLNGKTTTEKPGADEPKQALW